MLTSVWGKKEFMPPADAGAKQVVGERVKGFTTAAFTKSKSKPI